MGGGDVSERIIDSSQARYARFAGLLYLLLLAVDIAGESIVSAIRGDGSFADVAHRVAESETLYRVGLSLSLVGTLTTVVLALCLYATVRRVDGYLTLMALLFRLAESAIGAVGIVMAFSLLEIRMAANHAGAFDTNQLGALADLSAGTGSDVSAIFFTVGSAIFFYVFLRSNYVPRIISAWGILASLLYMTVWFVDLILPHHSGLVTIVGSLPILVAEVSMGLWLLLVGIRVPPEPVKEERPV